MNKKTPVCVLKVDDLNPIWICEYLYSGTYVAPT